MERDSPSMRFAVNRNGAGSKGGNDSPWYPNDAPFPPSRYRQRDRRDRRYVGRTAKACLDGAARPRESGRRLRRLPAHRLRAGRFARERPESWPFVTQELTSLIGTCQICNMRPQMRQRLPQSRLSSLRGRSAPVCCDSRIAGHPRFGTGLQTTLGWEADQGIRGDWDRLRKAHQPDRNLSGFGSDGKTNLPLKQALEVRT
jgi:hypothetical protein